MSDEQEPFYHQRHIIERRYTAGINNLFKLFMPIVDYWAIFDNSGIDRVKIASGKSNDHTVVYNKEVYEKINAYVRKRV